MVQALGISQTVFNPGKAGRLCRGRERWIEPFELEGDPVEISRLVLSGAEFKDDSAKDALRGLTHSGTDLASIICALFPRKTLLAFMEDGHPADIPEGVERVEAYEGYRAGGRSGEALVRWTKEVSGLREIRELVPDESADNLVRGFAVLDSSVDVEVLCDQLFLLTGMSTLDSPPARFQPAALPSVLEHCSTVVLLHRDKHGPALGIYSLEPIQVGDRLKGICEKAETLMVPFAIPPMLARWDRAISELRVIWEADSETPFPVPASDEPYVWDHGRRRRRNRRKDQRDGGEDNEADTDQIQDLAENGDVLTEQKEEFPLEAEEIVDLHDDEVLLVDSSELSLEDALVVEHEE